MRYFFFLFIAATVLIACNNSAGPVTGKDSTAIKSIGSGDTVAASEKINWIDDFKDFRDAVYLGKTDVGKTYFSFPLTAELNEIWLLADAPEEGEADLSHPFTEKDFDKHYSKIFTDEFIKTLLKVKSAELFSKGRTETVELKKGDSVRYKMYADFDRKENILTLNLAFEVQYSDEEEGEHNLIYTFFVLPNGKLRFRQINLAG